MKEFIATGRVTLEGVTFYVKAKSRVGALARLACGDYDSFDTSTAEIVDHHATPASVEENI